VVIVSASVVLIFSVWFCIFEEHLILHGNYLRPHFLPSIVIVSAATPQGKK